MILVWPNSQRLKFAGFGAPLVWNAGASTSSTKRVVSFGGQAGLRPYLSGQVGATEYLSGSAGTRVYSEGDSGSFG